MSRLAGQVFRIRLLYCVCLHLVCAAVAVAALPEREGYVSGRYGYSLTYPTGWFRDAGDPRFYIESFPSSKAIRAARLPKGGAAIIVLVAEQVSVSADRLPSDLAKWAELGTAHQKVIATRSIQVMTKNGTRPCVEVTTECCGAGVLQRSVGLYFQIRERFFSASVVYWEGDPSATAFEETLRGIVESLELVAPSSLHDKAK